MSDAGLDPEEFMWKTEYIYQSLKIIQTEGIFCFHNMVICKVLLISDFHDQHFISKHYDDF